MDGHQDAMRFGSRLVEADEREYKELYEAFLLNDGDRALSRVRGTQSASGRVDTIEGGPQVPDRERAQKTITELPMRYTKEIDRAIGQETIPPAHRDAVRGYFDR